MSKQDIYRNQYEQNMSGIKCFLRKYIKGFKSEESIGETLRNLDKKLMDIIVLKVSMIMQ